MQPGPTDEQSLILRAGPDAPLLRPLKVTLFGAGALGGHVAALLAQSGIDSLDIVDPDVLLPGNVVRHIAGHSYTGSLKAQAVHAMINDHAPWTQVGVFPEAPCTPGRIRQRIAEADIVIDATGSEALAGSVAVVAAEMGKPLVSGALYRGGFIGRVQRQASPSDTPIVERIDPERYPTIPAADDGQDFAAAPLGCSAPVNNAPPSSVTACASLIVQVAIDAMTNRFDFPDEVTDVYRAIPAPPFDKTGRVR